MGKWVMLLGLALFVIGAVLQFVPGLFSWFGKLPGDIRIESARGTVFIPVTSMILVSIFLSAVLSLFRR